MYNNSSKKSWDDFSPIVLNVVLFIMNILPLHFISHLLQFLRHQSNTKQNSKSGAITLIESWIDFSQNLLNVVLVILNILPLLFIYIISHLLTVIEISVKNITKQQIRGNNSYKESWNDYGPNALTLSLWQTPLHSIVFQKANPPHFLML